MDTNNTQGSERFLAAKSEIESYFEGVTVGHHRFMALCDLIEITTDFSKDYKATSERIKERCSSIKGYKKAFERIDQMVESLRSILREGELPRPTGGHDAATLELRSNTIWDIFKNIQARIYEEDED